MTFTHSTKTGGKRAITNYDVIKSNGKYTMLDVNIETGRKNQIRVHMTEMNHPIVGDKKYYSKDNSLGNQPFFQQFRYRTQFQSLPIPYRMCTYISR